MPLTKTKTGCYRLTLMPVLFELWCDFWTTKFPLTQRVVNILTTQILYFIIVRIETIGVKKE